jgi:hypothetical protein
MIAPSACAKSQTQADLPASCGRSGEQQTRDVRAGNEQHDTHERHDHEQGPGKFFPQVVLSTPSRQQPELRLIAIRPIGQRGLDGLLKRDFHSALGLRGCDTRLQTSHDQHPPIVAVAQKRSAWSVPVGRDEWLSAERHDEVGNVPRVDPGEARRVHAHYGDGRLIDGDSGADGRRIAAESPGPVTMADDSDDFRPAADVILWLDRTPRQRRHAHPPEEIPGYEVSLDQFRLTVDHDGDASQRLVGKHRVEDRRLTFERLEDRIREGRAHAATRRGPVPVSRRRVHQHARTGRP